MRILFTTSAGAGHFHPLVPLARAAAAAGHKVAFACPRSLCGTVEALGFPAFAAGRDHHDPDAELVQVMAEAHRMTPGPAQARFFITNVFFGINARRMVPPLMDVCTAWQPDLIVRENMEFGGAVVAEALGVPHATVQVAQLIDVRPMREAIAAQLDRARAMLDLPADPELGMLSRYLDLSFTPRSFQDPAVPVPPTLHTLRAEPFDRSGRETLPAWLDDLPRRPTIYATLGTEMNRGVPGIFPRVLQTIIAGLQEEPLNLIVTTGRECDPAALGPQPPHVHVERYIPQSLVFPRCDLIVTHGGHNTVLAAIAAGLPMVVVPITADQPENAARCAALGLGRVVSLAELTPDAIHEATCGVLRDLRYCASVLRLRSEMEALPGPDYGVRLLERLAVTKAPLPLPSRFLEGAPS